MSEHESSQSHRFLVTGATGGVGMALVEFLRKQDFIVYAMVRSTSSNRAIERLYHMGCKLIEGNLLEPETYSSSLEEVDVVIHTAAVVNPGDRSKHLDQVNIEGTKNLVEQMQLKGLDRLIHISTCGVYGYTKATPIHETDPLEAKSRYSVSKLRAEEIVQNATSINSTIIRCPYIIGPYDRHVLPTLYSTFNRKFSIKLLGKIGRNAFLHTSDLTRFIMLITAQPNQEFTIYNLQSGSFTINELNEAIREGANLTTYRIPFPTFGLFIFAPVLNIIRIIQRKQPSAFRRVKALRNNWVFSTARAKKAVGWHSQFLDNILYDEFVELVEKYTGNYS